MMTFTLFDFFLVSLLMGLAIGLDVAVATVARVGQLNTIRIVAIWVIGVSLTHTLFPMFGYLLAYFSVQVQPALTPVIGIVAFLCIFVFLKTEFKQLIYPEQESEQSQLLITIGLILAVSWDALWSGPAISAQVIGWPQLMVWGSFLIVGIIVSCLAILSFKAAMLINHFVSQRVYMGWVFSWIQYSIIGYFGLLALLRYTLQINMYWWQILMVSFALMAICIWLCVLMRENNRALA